jgi:protein-disulfide isomerase
MTTYVPHLALPVTRRDHVRGPETASITLVEFGDFQCHDSAAAQEVVRAVLAQEAEDVRLVYRHFPLRTIHRHAQKAAEAAEAAGSQGRFWAMHDRLFEHQDALGDAEILAQADALGLDVARFAQELAEEIYASRVQDDFTSGVRSGVSGTPTFFVNGIKHEGPRTADALLRAIEAARAEGD